MPVEQQPQQTTAGLFQTLCYRAFADVSVHRNLRELAFKMVPEMNSFEATVVGYISFLTCGPNYECFVKLVPGDGGRGCDVQLQYKGYMSSASVIIDPGHSNNMQMLQDIFTRIRKFVESDRLVQET